MRVCAAVLIRNDPVVCSVSPRRTEWNWSLQLQETAPVREVLSGSPLSENLCCSPQGSCSLWGAAGALSAPLVLSCGSACCTGHSPFLPLSQSDGIYFPRFYARRFLSFMTGVGVCLDACHFWKNWDKTKGIPQALSAGFWILKLLVSNLCILWTKCWLISPTEPENA